MNKKIQILRGMLCLVILFFHCKTFPVISEYGWLATEIFFAISGFYIFKKLLTQKPGGCTFVMNRIKRLLKEYNMVYIIIFVICMILILLMLFECPIIGWLGLKSEYIKVRLIVVFMGFIGMSTPVGLQVGDLSYLYKFMLHTWTVSVEIEMVIIIAALYVFVKKIHINNKYIPDLLIIGACIFYIVDLMTGYKLTLMNPFMHMLAFGLGGVAYRYISEDVQNKIMIYENRLCIYMGLLMIAAEFFFHLKNKQMILTMGSAFIAQKIIILCYTDSNYKHKVFPKVINRILLWIGDNSYFFYLIHFPIYAVFAYVIINRYILTLLCLIFTIISVIIKNSLYNLTEKRVNERTKSQEYHKESIQ